MRDVGPKGRAEAETTLAERARSAVKERLFDPESAAFRKERQSKVRSEWWCGEVNARNRMGGMGGFMRYVVEISKDPRPELDEAHLDPAGTRDTAASNDATRFAAYWNGYCQ